jgi:hypothetical protein
MDFTELTEENRLVWLKFLADTVPHLNRERISLQSQLNEYRQQATIDLEHNEKLAFVANVSPTIKSHMFEIFIRLIFPSTVEVTSSRDCRTLLSFGLTEQCPLAVLVFDCIFKRLKGTESLPLYIGDNESVSASSATSSVGHAFNTPGMRAKLWFDLGIGTFAVKSFNASRNTYTNMIREVVSKFCCVMCFLLTLI